MHLVLIDSRPCCSFIAMCPETLGSMRCAPKAASAKGHELFRGNGEAIHPAAFNMMAYNGVAEADFVVLAAEQNPECSASEEPRPGSAASCSKWPAPAATTSWG